MDVSTTQSLGQLSPPVDPTAVNGALNAAPHPHPTTTTTVTSANTASVGEVHLSTGPPPAERRSALSESTPRRRTSFLEQQQVRTPRGSLHWPSTHRSVSSAAPTRDSSRHSQLTDNAAGLVMGVSRTTSLHARTASTPCRTPLSTRGRESEHGHGHGPHGGQALSAEEEEWQRRHSAGGGPRAPPLVDLRASPAPALYSPSHSTNTTGLCTPREVGSKTTTTHTATTATHAVSHSSPFLATAGTRSATVSGGSRGLPTPAPPPDDFEGAAQTLSREELEDSVVQMRGDNVVLRTSVIRLREALAMLQEGMRANYADLERRQDNIANMLLRRLEATKQRRARLVAHLRTVEAEKASQEAKLKETTTSIRDLSFHLRQEEQEIADRLQGRLLRLHAQREQLDKVLAEQTSSLQQLIELVGEVEELDTRDVAPATTTATTAVVSPPPPGLSAAESAVNTSASASVVPVPTETTPSVPSISVPPPASGAAAVSAVTTRTTTSAAVPAVALPSPTAQERSSSRISGTGSATPGPAPSTASVAYDPNAMIRYLVTEIAAAESLRADALKKADAYVATRDRLAGRLQSEKKQRTAQESRTAALRQELRDTSSAVHARAAAQEMSLEREVDRHLNSSRTGGGGAGDIFSSASSACGTPRIRAVSAGTSRGNSVSPCAGRTGAASTLAAGSGAEGGSMNASPGVTTGHGPTDSFLLPSSSFSSNPPVSTYTTPHAGTSGGVGVAPAIALPPSATSRAAMASLGRDEAATMTTPLASSEGTPHTTRLLVQDTTRMAAPRLVTSADSTPQRTPLATPQLSMAQGPAL